MNCYYKIDNYNYDIYNEPIKKKTIWDYFFEQFQMNKVFRNAGDIIFLYLFGKFIMTDTNGNNYLKLIIYGIMYTSFMKAFDKWIVSN